jgi:predicted butyrate kinase (DUF1464 family)
MKIVLILALSLSLSQALVYHCDYRTTAFVNVGYAYTCFYPSIVEVGDGRTVTGVSGTHLSAMNNDDVEGIYAINHNTTAFPRNLANFFPNLKVLQWRYSQFVSISSEDL